MEPHEYFSELQSIVHDCPYVEAAKMGHESGAEYECKVEGTLLLVGNLRLHVAEFVTTSPALTLHKYRYHLQRGDGMLIRRWDNAPHHRGLSSFPHHVHLPDGLVEASNVRSLANVLACLPRFLEP